MTRKDSEDLQQITALTLRHYDDRAVDFWAGTRDHDVSQNIDALLGGMITPPPFTILDFGCGPGRDLKTFVEMGHVAVGLEGAPSFARMARDYSGCEVWEQDFVKLNLPPEYFDGVYANATLFHIPTLALPRVLLELKATIKPGGVLFSSNPRGKNEEGWHHGRYGVFHDLESWRQYMTNAGFIEVNHYYRPAGLPRAAQPWLASVWRR